MIDIELCREGNEWTVSVTGHSGAAQKGQDILCAAVSVLTQTLGVAVLSLIASGKIEESGTVALKDGFALINARAKKANVNEVGALFGFAATGYKLLGEHYPEHIHVTENGY